MAGRSALVASDPQEPLELVVGHYMDYVADLGWEDWVEAELQGDVIRIWVSWNLQVNSMIKELREHAERYRRGGAKIIVNQR